MAKAAGTCRIVIPQLHSPSGSFKAAGRNEIYGEVNRNLAEQLKSEYKGDGSDLTPRSRASWASQVEEEHEATGWTGLPRPGKEGSKGAVSSVEKPDDATTKSKKKKNKKKSKGASSVDDLCSPTSVGQKWEERFKTQYVAKALEGGVLDTNATQSEFPVSSPNAEGSNLVDNVDKKGRNGEGSGSPVGGIKGSNAVWALKHSDSRRKSLPGSAWQPVGVKEASTCNDGGDSGWNSPSPAVKLTGGPSGGWGSPPQGEVVEDSGWSVVPSEESADAANTPNGTWDEPVVDASSTWDSGWEVAGSRRGKKGEDLSSKSPSGQRGKGGRGFQANSSADYVPKGAKQRSHEWEKVSKGVRSPGRGFQEKGGWQSPRKQPGPSNFGTARQHPTQSSWTKSLNKSTSNNSSNWDTASGQGGNSVNESNSVNSASIVGNLLPRGHIVPDSNPETQSVNSSSISLNAWKGGLPAFSGNGSSVFDDYQASLYSDSQCSNDDDLDSDTVSLSSFESKESHKSHSAQRMNKWFRNFFQDLDLLTEEQVSEHDRQWHCPACQGGVGAIDWYRGLQPLLAHTKTVRSKRVKLHKAFAEVLEEEIRIRGAALGTNGNGKYGKWRGLGDENESKLIMWPPMVVVRNTQLEQDEDDKWIGMGNKELLDLFKTHNPVKARHAYGPQGHRGISILIFADSPTGYYSAQRLETQFIEARRGKDNWDASGKLLFQPGGDRILYGYMATADDLEMFNKHSKGKQNLKWEMKSFQDMVLSPMRKLDEENNKVTILQGKVQREQETRRALTKKLELREEELRVVRDRGKEQHQQQQIEMEDMEVLYKQKIEQLKQEILEKQVALERFNEEYEKEHMEECEKLQQQVSKIPKDESLSDEQQQQQTLVEEEISRHSQLVEMCIKNQEQWEARKAELLKEHHQKMMEFKARQWEELIKFELKLDKEREEVMEAFKFPTKIQTLSESSK
ncbi:unnamed protein product [Calypogeia fissa]